MKLQKPILIMLWILFMLLIIHNSHRIIRIVNENFSVNEQFQTTEFEGNSSYGETTIDPTNYSEPTIDPTNESTVDPYSEVTEGTTNYTTEGPLTTVNYRPKKIQMIALRRKYNAPGYLIIIKNSQDQRLHIVRSRHKIPKSINIVEEKINVTFDNDDDTDVISFELIRQLYYNNIEETRTTTEGTRVTTEGTRVTTEGTRVTEGQRYTTPGQSVTTQGQSDTTNETTTNTTRRLMSQELIQCHAKCDRGCPEQGCGESCSFCHTNADEGFRLNGNPNGMCEPNRCEQQSNINMCKDKCEDRHGQRSTTQGQSVTTLGQTVTAEHFQLETANSITTTEELREFIIPTGPNELDYTYNNIDYTISEENGEVAAPLYVHEISGSDDSLETFFGLEEPTITTSPVPAIKCMDEEIRSGHKHCVSANTLSLNKNVHSAWRDDNKCVKLGNNEPCFHCPAGTYIDYDNFNSVCSKCPYGTSSVKANSFECTPMGGQTTTTTQLFPKQPIADNLQDALNSLGQRNNEKFKKFESLQGRLERCKDKFDSFREYSIQ